MLQDKLIKNAVSCIIQRSERQHELHKILASFVDIGILPQLLNFNNQIVYGRRGTGKTHILKVLASKLNNDPANVIVYIDARTLGSTSQFTDSEVPLKIRCLSLFQDILGEICNKFMEHIINTPSSEANQALNKLDDLMKISTEPMKKFTNELITTRSLDKKNDKGSINCGIENVAPNISGNLSNESSTENEVTTSYRVSQEEKVIFPQLHHLLKEILDKSESTLYLLIDEWSSLPFEIQPYLAEFLKRGFITNPKIVIKIAALEYRSNFQKRLDHDNIGFELGGEFSTTLDLDDYYVYDRNPKNITLKFSEILLKHINIELPDNYLASTYKIFTGEDLSSRMFTEKITFEELVRASEGVARDLINIFNAAFFDSQRRERDSIDKKSILEAARQWFEKDKIINLDETLQQVLKKIVLEVIGKRKARSFLLPRELEKDPIIMKLFDYRVLHLMQRGYADKDNPGMRYNIYTLDYGTYVNLINTSNKPQIEFIEFIESENKELVVPFDDKRSIRRIILTKSILS